MGSILKKILYFLLAIVLLLNIYILVTGKYYIYSAFYHNFAGIDDYKIFPNREIPASSNPEPWPISYLYNKKNISPQFRNVLEGSSSVAFLVIKQDSLLYEEYWDGYSENSFSSSFSVAKSIVSALIGAAIREGKIKNVDQKISDFLPEFRTEKKKDITIKDVLMMSSGIEWDEAYANPFSITTEAYYGNDLYKIMKDLEAEKKPGEEFEYKSGDTQILGFVLEKATGKTLSEYAYEKLWEPMGAERKALWSLDREDGHEKAYCCYNSNARDFARLGYLYLHKGNWKGKQLVDTSYVEASVAPNFLKFKDSTCNFYGYQWWVIPDCQGEKVFYARGILGQIILVIPSKEIVAVRLGHWYGGRKGMHFSLVYDMVNEIKNYY
jgi:CubicO group peptidase (beta-lactamase class C family)